MTRLRWKRARSWAITGGILAWLLGGIIGTATSGSVGEKTGSFMAQVAMGFLFVGTFFFAPFGIVGGGIAGFIAGPKRGRSRGLSDALERRHVEQNFAAPQAGTPRPAPTPGSQDQGPQQGRG